MSDQPNYQPAAVTPRAVQFAMMTTRFVQILVTLVDFLQLLEVFKMVEQHLLTLLLGAIYTLYNTKTGICDHPSPHTM